jgi:hypothetical protein
MVDEDALTFARRFDTRAERGDDADRLVAGVDGDGRDLAGRPAVAVEVGAADGRSRQPHDDLAGAGLRVGSIDDDRLPVAQELNGAHTASHSIGPA